MPHYASADDRSRFTAGLRALADYLKSRTDVPIPWSGACIHVFPARGTNEEQRAEIDAIAARMSAEPREITSGHYSVSRFFGPVEYRAVAIDRTSGGSDGE